MAKVEVANLTKTYGKRRGVEELTFTVEDKEFLVIFGPAGAGKTTTLNLIAGTVPPDTGSIMVGNRAIDGLEPADRNVAMVFESYALYPQLSVFENMAFPLKSPKYKQADAQVKEKVMSVAKMMKIDHLVDRKIQALSNGQRQRTALGRALVRNPQVFLLDEPLSHLDAKLRHSMRAELKEMRAQLGTTTIYVTHDYLEAMSLGDRIMVLDQGRVQQIGTPEEVYFRPATAGVAKLFGDPEINLVNSEIRSGAGIGIDLFGTRLDLAANGGLSQSNAKAITVGFRPSNVELLPEGQKGVPAVVYSFEPLGTKSIVTLDVAGGGQVRALVDGRQLYQADRRVQFKVAAEHLMLFDQATQRFIRRGAEVNRENS